ncbi:hypothetical protein CBR_g49754 [Chara braunii]|uniref:CCHC-type domain-containing protein n=1 Tax=Chara braunii TaxID=69332 RepID=A0A388M5P1_CHABU|nr:hypothetical protein CBR_g49754 [Chara braunii]|eukprot:GBG89904.1 hypothetical protein CBR_g49754 [Chara braunii]
MLGQNGSNGEVGGLGGDVEMASGVGDLEDGGSGDELFYGIEGVLAAVVPSEGFVLAGEFVERVQDVGEVANKGAVVDREDLAEMLKVGLEGGAIDEDVIEVDDNTDFEEVAEDVIHGGLKCGRGIVVDRFLWTEGGGDEGGPLKEGVRSEIGVMAVGHVGVPPASGTCEESAAGDGELVDDRDVVEGEVVDAGGGVDDVLAERTVDVDREGSGADVVWGEVVKTVMAGVFPSIVVMRLEMVEMEVFMSVMEVFTREMDDWRDFIIWSRAAKSGAAGVAAGWSPARLRVMLSTESVLQHGGGGSGATGYTAPADGTAACVTGSTTQVIQGPGQTQWVPKTAIAAPKPFTGDKRGEDLDTWLRAVPVYVKCKLTLPHEEVLVAASYLEGSAARWLSDLVQLQGYGHDFRAWAAHQKLEDFLKMVEERWHDPQEAQKDTDAILTLHTRQFKSIKEATDAVERLICVPGVRYDPQVLLTSYLRCFPMPLRNQLAGEANINVHNFPSFSKKALDLEAKIGHGHNPTTEGRKKTLPPNWKTKGRIMFVGNDGSTIELDDNFQEGVGSEVGSVEASEGGVVTAVAQKGKATGRRRGGPRSRSKVDPNAPPWEKAGLTKDMWRDRYTQLACIRCGQYGHNQFKCRNKKVTDKIPPTMGQALGSSHPVGSNVANPDKPFIVTTDASQYGIGVVLAQQKGKKLRRVEYMSKKMPSQKLAKSTYEKELYAVYKALTHWRHYLLGRFFTLRTDHQTLRWMRTQSVLSGALKHWIKVIEQYNKVADALSRRPDFSELGEMATEEETDNRKSEGEPGLGGSVAQSEGGQKDRESINPDGLWSLRERVLGWFDPEGTMKTREEQKADKEGPDNSMAGEASSSEGSLKKVVSSLAKALTKNQGYLADAKKKLTFDGANITEFLIDYENLVALLKWTEEEKMDHLGQHVSLSLGRDIMAIVAASRSWKETRDVMMRKYLAAEKMATEVDLAAVQRKNFATYNDFLREFTLVALRIPGVTDRIMSKYFLRQFSEFDKDKIMSAYQQMSKFVNTRDVDFNTVTDLAEKTVVTETLALLKEGEVIDLTGRTSDKVKKGIESLHERVHGVDSKIERMEGALLVMQAQVSRSALPPHEAVVPPGVANRGFRRRDPANEQCKYCTVMGHYVRACPKLNHDILKRRCTRSLKGEIFGPQGERVNWNSPGGMRRAVIMLNGLEITTVEAEPVVDIVWDQQRGRGPQVNFILESDGRDRINATTRLGTAGRRINRDAIMEEVVGSSELQAEPEAEEPEKVYGKPREEEPADKVTAAKKKFRYQIPILNSPEIDDTISKLLGTMVSVSFQTMLQASPRLLKGLRQLLTRRRVEIGDNPELPEGEKEEEAPQEVANLQRSRGDLEDLEKAFADIRLSLPDREGGEVMRSPPGTKLSFHALPVGKLKVQIGSHHTDALVDGGAEITLVRRDFATITRCAVNKEVTGSIRGVGGEIPFAGYVTKCDVKAGVRESIWSFQRMTEMEDMDHDIILGRPWCANVEMIGMHLHDGSYMIDIEDPVTGQGELLRVLGIGGDPPKGKLATWSPSFEDSTRKGAFARMEGMRERVEIMIEEAFNKKEWIKMGLPQKKRRQEDEVLGVMVAEKESEVQLGASLPKQKEVRIDVPEVALEIPDLLQLVKALRYHKVGVDSAALAKFKGEVHRGYCLNGKLDPKGKEKMKFGNENDSGAVNRATGGEGAGPSQGRRGAKRKLYIGLMGGPMLGRGGKKCLCRKPSPLRKGEGIEISSDSEGEKERANVEEGGNTGMGDEFRVPNEEGANKGKRREIWHGESEGEQGMHNEREEDEEKRESQLEGRSGHDSCEGYGAGIETLFTYDPKNLGGGYSPIRMEDEEDEEEDVREVIEISSRDERDEISRPREEGRPPMHQPGDGAFRWEDEFGPTPSHWFQQWTNAIRHEWIVKTRELARAGVEATPLDFFNEEELRKIVRIRREIETFGLGVR